MERSQSELAEKSSQSIRHVALIVVQSQCQDPGWLDRTGSKFFDNFLHCSALKIILDDFSDLELDTGAQHSECWMAVPKLFEKGRE